MWEGERKGKRKEESGVSPGTRVHMHTHTHTYTGAHKHIHRSPHLIKDPREVGKLLEN